MNIPDVTQDGEIDLTLEPTGVNPAPIMDNVQISLIAINTTTTESITTTYTVNNNVITIPANTFESGEYTLIIAYGPNIVKNDVTIGS